MKLSIELYTDKVQESIDFYCNHLGFTVKKSLEGFAVLQHKTNPEYEIMFCAPNSPFVNRLFHPPFAGQGIILQVEVENVDAVYAEFRQKHLAITLDLIDEPVNGRHFTITDPNGLLIDIVQFK